MRTSGILLPITSLPGKYGIGCFGKEAMDFVDFLVKCGNHYWQILPVGPTGFGDSPYQSYSTFAISPMLIDLESLVEDGELTAEECKVLEGFSDEYVDFDAITGIKMKLLKKAYGRRTDHKGLEEFASKEAYWLDAYAIFMGIHDKFDKVSYTEWEEAYRKPDWTVVDKFKEEYAEEINFHRYVQYKAFSQWEKVKKYANDNGIKIVGDLPIYVSPDGADVWINREMFVMDNDGVMENMAGCPGDAYAPKGQLWGNPLYDWEYHKRTGYEWWVSRMKKALSIYDVVRIDHFRGFDEYYSIPYGDEDASRGQWLPGPGMDLFNVLKAEIGELNVICEDLGFLTDSVRKLRSDSGFPGMKVLQFAYGGDATNEYLPHLHPQNSVVYTGTHDNMTTLGWLLDKDTDKKIIDHIIEYHGFDRHITMKTLAKKLINVAYASVSDTCIIPLQDHLGLDNDARINTPSTVGGNNWKWRVDKKLITDELAKDVKALNTMYGR